MPEREQRERSLSTLNKVGQFLSDFRLRNILGQAASGFNIDEVMASRKVFIANLSQGTLGDREEPAPRGAPDRLVLYGCSAQDGADAI